MPANAQVAELVDAKKIQKSSTRFFDVNCMQVRLLPCALNQISQSKMEGTIKERLLKRFTDAREKLGRDWRDKVAESDAFYATREGEKQLVRVVGSVTDPRRAGVDVIERLANAMERVLSEEPAEV